MNWFKKAQYAGYKMILWHATIPRFADMIVQQGAIKPDNTIEKETGQSHAGWNFSLTHLGDLQYGDGVYLSTNKLMAIDYARIRLEKEWEEIEDLEQLFYEEEFGFIGLFRVFVKNTNVLIPDTKTTKPDTGMVEEYLYTGNILSQPNPDAWFDSPEWIDKTNELEKHIERKERILRELQESITSNELV